MLDYVKLVSPVQSFPKWKEKTGLTLFTEMNLDTGSLKDCGQKENTSYIHRGESDGYKCRIIETQRSQTQTDCLLVVMGSLHKSFMLGENYFPFRWSYVQDAITDVANTFSLDEGKTRLQNIEIGVNIRLPFSPFEYLDSNFISYKGKERRKYDPDRRKGVSIGFECPQTQYRIKIYDKGLQYELAHHLMRFEIHYKKMQIVNKKGIVSLADLRCKEKVMSLLPLLLKAWDGMLVYDNSIDMSTIPMAEKQLLEFGRSLQNWQELRKQGANRYNYQMRLFKACISRYGTNYHSLIKELIKIEWKQLMEN